MDAFTNYKSKQVDEDCLPEVSIEEVALHNSPNDLWIVIHGKVYNVSEWKDSHPGGEDVLIENGGKDASELFNNVGHSPDAIELRANYLIARLKKSMKNKL